MDLTRIYKTILLFSFIGILFIPVCSAQPKEGADNGKSQKILTEGDKKYYLHTVDINQTLTDIGKIYGLTIDEIIAENPKAVYGVRAGVILKLPFKEPVEVLKPAIVAATPPPSPFKISGYVDAYYAYYTDSVGVNNYQKFPVISPKSNVFGINIVQLSAQYAAEKVRFTGTFHYGDIPASAWSPVYNMIQEANVGVRLTKKIWLDAGLFKTHIGTEALLPKDNIASSLSIITFYEPWWQTGIKLSYAPNDKWLFCLHILNGYNTYIDNNSSKSIGLAVSYALSDKGNINYYNLIGDEFPDGTKDPHIRFLNNVVFNYQITPKFKISAGADYITQTNSNIVDSVIRKSDKTAVVYSGILTLKYQIIPKLGIYARGETFSDNDGFLTGTMVDEDLKITGYKVSGATLGVEFKPVDNAFIRLEARDLMMDDKQKIFHTAGGTNTNSRVEAMINIGVWF